jgi:uncharacterized protein (DUF1800 family)
MSAVMVLL